MNRWDLVRGLVGVALAEDAAATGEPILAALLAFTGGRRAAIFEASVDQMRLAHSRGIDEEALRDVEVAWRAHRPELAGGRPMLGQRSVVFPVLDGRHLIGLLFADRTQATPFTDERDLQALAGFARLVARVLSRRRADPTGYLASTRPEDVARDQLLVLLEQHEWNIARVARVLGVTRPTVYARLRRYGLPRLRFAKRQSS